MLNFAFGILVGGLIMGILLKISYSRAIQNLKDNLYFLEREIERLKKLVAESKSLTDTQKGKANH